MSSLRICKLIRKHSFLDIRVFLKQARSLAAMGHDVVIAAPSRRGVLRDVNKQAVRMAHSGLFIIDNVTMMPYKASRISPSLNTLLNQFQNKQFDIQIDELLATALAVNADVYHAHEPETLFEAIQIKRLFAQQGKSVKVIFDAHELEPESSFLKAMLIEADHMVTVSDSIADIYRIRYPHLPITVIYNSPTWNSKASIKPSPHRIYTEEKPFTIGFEGILTKEKGDPYRMQDILNKLSGKGLPFKWKVLGQARFQNVEVQKKVEGWLTSDTRVHYEWMPYEQLQEHWRDVDAGYIYFDLRSLNRLHALPNKLFSLMNGGVPIVSNAAAAISEVILKHQCGIVIDNKQATSEQYAEQFEWLYRNHAQLNKMGKNGNEAVKMVYGWEIMERRLADMYRSLQ